MTDLIPADLTKQQLADIEARLTAATPGPWGVYEGAGGLIDIAADLEETGHGYRARREIARLEEEPMDNDPAHREWTAEQDWAQIQADAQFIAHAPADVTALLAEVHRLRAELTEEKAARDPRLRCLIVKAAPDKDLYIGWSNVCEMPAGVWTRAEAEEYGFPLSRLERADKNGSSDLSCGDGHWGDKGFVAEQLGWLHRDRLADYAVAYLDGDRPKAYALLEPFEGETEVRTPRS